MNAQRWIAVGFLGLIALCIASSNLWLPFFDLLGGDDEDDATPTPTGEVAEAEGEEGEGDGTGTPEAVTVTETPEPTLDPVVAEMLAEIEVEELGPGIDPFITRAGNFTTVDPMHRAEGTASLFRLSETQHVLRLDPFEVTSGPDLKVILSPSDNPRTSSETMLPTHLNLGDLKSSSGAQNYPIPEGENISQYRSVVIYSMSLNIVYSSAPLTEVRGGS